MLPRGMTDGLTMKKTVGVALALFLAPASLSAQQSPTTDPNPEVAAFERYDSENSSPRNAVLFAGSSSINLWRTAEAFPGTVVINRGFGGSTAEELVRYSRQLITKYKPRVVVLYTGENDVFLGKSAPQVLQTLDGLVAGVRRDLPCAKLVYLSIKPSLSRLHQIGEQRLVNEGMRNRAARAGFTYVDVASALMDPAGKPDSTLFSADQLHLNGKGYAVWNKILAPHLRLGKNDTLRAQCTRD